MYNPYERVPVSRIERVRELRDVLLQEPQAFYQHISEQVAPSFRQATDQFIAQWLQPLSLNERRDIKNFLSAIIWLLFNPKVLNLPDKQIWQFYYFSLTYGTMLNLKFLPKLELGKNSRSIVEQLCWALVKTVQSEFWLALQELNIIRRFKKLERFMEAMVEAF